MEYKNKSGKEEGTSSLKDQITIKKETVLKEEKVKYWSLVHSIIALWDTETKTEPAMATGCISLSAGVSPLQSFHWVYYHYRFL